MSYIGDTVNTSATLAGCVAAKTSAGAGCAVKFNATGDIALCDTAGEAALGVLLAQTPDEVAAGDAVSVQIKDVGLWLSGGSFDCGALLATDASGHAVEAQTGDFILGMALEASGAAGQLCRVQLVKGGFMA